MERLFGSCPSKEANILEFSVTAANILELPADSRRTREPLNENRRTRYVISRVAVINSPQPAEPRRCNLMSIPKQLNTISIRAYFTISLDLSETRFSVSRALATFARHIIQSLKPRRIVDDDTRQTRASYETGWSS